MAGRELGTRQRIACRNNGRQHDSQHHGRTRNIGGDSDTHEHTGTEDRAQA
jgi:hypothetical protein